MTLDSPAIAEGVVAETLDSPAIAEGVVAVALDSPAIPEGVVVVALMRAMVFPSSMTVAEKSLADNEISYLATLYNKISLLPFVMQSPYVCVCVCVCLIGSTPGDAAMNNTHF